MSLIKVETTTDRPITAEMLADTSDTYHFAVNSSRNFRFDLSGLSGDNDC